MSNALQGRWDWWGEANMVDQDKADAFADFLKFNEYAACIPVGSKKLYMTCDGVGTKLYIAEFFNKWDTIGIDLVAMCANDLLCCGAAPRAFMDYYAMEDLDLNKSKEIIKGVKEGCRIAGCELVGGETAQLRGMFRNAHSFDLAGFAVGATHEYTRMNSVWAAPKAGDYIVGIPSSGIHSNGYTFLKERVSYVTQPEEWLLTPTRIYTQEILDNLNNIKRCAHVTGGGLNRAMKRLLGSSIKHKWLGDKTKIPWSSKNYEGSIWDRIMSHMFNSDELLNNFNCGWGMIIVTDTLDLDIEDAEHIGNII